MHQKNNQAAEPSAATLHSFDDDDDEDDEVDVKNPFADGEDDIDDDEDEDGLQDDGKGSWWRGVVKRKGNNGKDSDDDNDHDDDDEFGDFAMAEEDKEKDEDAEKVVLKPLAVNPAKEGTRGLSGLWPFGTKTEKDKEKQQPGEKEGTLEGESVDLVDEKKAGSEQPAAVEVKEAKRRTSIEDPDEEEVVV